VVVALAWLIQPSRNLEFLHEVNVDGSGRVFDATAAAGVPALVHGSSIGAYSPGPKDRRVDESWPTEGLETSFYARHKAATERLLDRFEAEHPAIRVVRVRPGLVFKGEAASEVRRLFAGPLLPSFLLRPGLIPLFPDVPRLRVQAVHSFDLGEAYRQTIVRDVRGAFNVAAEPVLDVDTFTRILRARSVPAPRRLVRIAAAASWRLRLQPTPEGWVDMGLSVPLMDTTRAQTELGWQPRFSAADAFLELLEGMRRGQGFDTPPLAASTSGPLRVREFATRIGGRST
jgi:nucleoside-diphosphate-sugar epimerase